MIQETNFTVTQVLRDLNTLMKGIDRSESSQAEYLYLSIRNTLLWLPAEHTSDK